MSLTERRIPQDLPLFEPSWLGRLVELGLREWEEWEAESSVAAPGFVPGAYTEAASILNWFRRTHSRPGSWFCEWGSGLGVVAVIADLLGWQSVGIEIESALVERAHRIAQAVGSQARFQVGSFLPPGADVDIDTFGEPSWLDPRVDDTYSRLELEIDDFELIYIYPWPGERALMLELFRDFARVGAWLLSYHGAGEWHLWQKVSGRRV